MRQQGASCITGQRRWVSVLQGKGCEEWKASENETAPGEQNSIHEKIIRPTAATKSYFLFNLLDVNHIEKARGQRVLLNDG